MFGCLRKKNDIVKISIAGMPNSEEKQMQKEEIFSDQDKVIEKIVIQNTLNLNNPDNSRVKAIESISEESSSYEESSESSHQSH